MKAKLSLQAIKRFVCDWTGNYAFFVPVVGVLNWLVAGWTWNIFIGYALTSIVVAAVSGRAFTLFLLNFWYPKVWRIKL